MANISPGLPQSSPRPPQPVVLLACICMLRTYTNMADANMARILNDNFPNLPVTIDGIQRIYRKVCQVRPEWLYAMRAAAAQPENDPITAQTILLLRLRALRLPWVMNALQWHHLVWGSTHNTVRLLSRLIDRGELLRI